MDNGVLMWLVAYFSAETLKTRRKWENIFKCRKKKISTKEFLSRKTISFQKIREELRHIKINKNWGNSLPLDLTYEKF